MAWMLTTMLLRFRGTSGPSATRRRRSWRANRDGEDARFELSSDPGETVTTSKKDNLILNVDGCIAVSFIDLMRSCGAFSIEEAEEYMKMGVLNGLFVLGRSTGLIAHYLDQKRLKTSLYRHPWDDITYLLPTLTKTGPGPVGEGRVEVSMK